MDQWYEKRYILSFPFDGQNFIVPVKFIWVDWSDDNIFFLDN